MFEGGGDSSRNRKFFYMRSGRGAKHPSSPLDLRQVKIDVNYKEQALGILYISQETNASVHVYSY